METTSFADFMNQVIEDLKKEERYGTAYIYGYALRAFCQFMGTQDVPFSAFTKAEMKQFELFLQDRKRAGIPFLPIFVPCVQFIIVRWILI